MYNCAAEVYIKMIENCVFSQERIKNIYRNRMNEIIKKSSSFKSAFDKVQRILDEEFINESFIVDCLAYLVFVDSQAKNNIDLETQAIEDKKPLNNKYTEKICIYFTYTMIKRNNVTCHELPVIFDSLMFFYKGNNIYYLDLKNIVLQNYYYTEANLNKILLGIAPYPCVNVEKIENDGKVYFSERNELTKEDNVFLEKINMLLFEDGCKILLTPEIHGSKKIDERLKLAAHNSKTMICVSPSYHKMVDDNRYNQSTIYCYENNRTKECTISKTFPATMINKKENIDLPNIVYLFIYHIKNFGKIAVLICKDFITDTFSYLIKLLNIDVVLIQCYSDVTKYFVNKFRELGQEKRIMILANSCSALNDDKICVQIGMFVKSGKNECSTKVVSYTCGNNNLCTTCKCNKIIEMVYNNDMILLSSNGKEILKDGEIDGLFKAS